MMLAECCQGTKQARLVHTNQPILQVCQTESIMHLGNSHINQNPDRSRLNLNPFQYRTTLLYIHFIAIIQANIVKPLYIIQFVLFNDAKFHCFYFVTICLSCGRFYFWWALMFLFLM